MTAPGPKPLRLRDQLIRSFAGVGALRALSMPISLVASIVLARTLGPDAFGQYAFIMALVPLMALPVANGLPQLLTREVAKCAGRRAWETYRGIFRFAYSWVLGYSAVLIVAVWLYFGLGGGAGLAGKWQLLPLAVLVVPLAGLLAVIKGTTKGLGHIAVSELPEQFIRPLAFLAAVAAIALAGSLSPATAIGGQIVAVGLGFLGGAWLLKRRRPGEAARVTPQYAPGAWSRALLPLTLLAFLGLLNSQVAIVLLGLLDTNAAVGAFQVATSGAGIVAVSLALVNMVIAPQIVKFRLAGDRANLQLLSRQSARAAFALAAPVAIAYFLFGEPIIRLLFGDAYAGTAVGPLVILAAAHLVNVFVGSVGLLLIMSDHEMDTLWSQGLALTINVVACVILIPAYGATGAAIGTAAGLVAWNILLAVQVKRRLSIRPTAL